MCSKAVSANPAVGVRVAAQLIEVDTSHHVMAERYDRDLTDLFELQDEITHAIAGAIEPELLKFERDRIVERPPRSEDAYELYQRGMWHHYRNTRADNIEAQSYFRRALAIDAQYPQAAAALTIAVLNAGFLGWAESDETNFAEAYELGEWVIRLDPRYPNAHFAFGLACMWTRRSERGIASFEEAIKLNPSFAAAHVMLGQMYVYAGRREEAIELVETGIRLSPTDPRLDRWLPALAGAHLPNAALCGGHRSRAAFMVTQPKLAAWPALCRRRAGSAREDPRGPGGARRTQTDGREPGIFSERFSPKLARSG